MEHRWLNYDLHMHSYYSKDSETSGMVKEMSAKEFVDILIHNGIDVFSITDHKVFNAQYYKEILDYVKDKKIKIIPGCEFNVYLDKKTNDYFHANIYFDPKNLDPKKLEEVIKKLYSGGNKPLLGKIINELNANSFSYLIFPEADKGAGIDKVWNKIKELGETDRFLKNGMQRIFKGYDSTDSFNETSANMWALNYFKHSRQFANIIAGKQDEEINLLTQQISQCIKKRLVADGFSEEVINLTKIICEYGRYFSYFHFSDWHNAKSYSNSHRNLIFGSKDLFFETLELATVDPVSRVMILKKDDILKSPINFIKKLSFKMNGKPYEINFEVGLNAIVGKRASGKSLLVSIILLLLNKNDKKYDETYSNYYDVDKDSIIFETYDGAKLGIGQLSSLEYIKQNTINEIFSNPDLSSSYIKSKFPKIEDVDMSSYRELVSLLEIARPIDTNYKNLGAYFKLLNGLKKYTYGISPLLDLSPLQTYFKNISKSTDTFIDYVRKIGFSGNEFLVINKIIRYNSEIFAKKVYLYNDVINFINGKISKLIAMNTQIEERAKIERDDFNNNKKIIFKRIDALLYIQKINWYLDNFNLEVPPLAISDNDNYIFITRYLIDPDLKDNLIDCIANNIKKVDGCSGLDLIHKYYFNQSQLKANKKGITDGLETKYIVSNIKIMHEIYEKYGNIDISKIKNLNDIEKFIEDSLLENISTSSIGKRSAVYLDLMLTSDANILMFDQPEDNIDNDYISSYFVPLIKRKKNTKQLIFVTHNPSIAVYADAFNYIYATNDGGKSGISYNNYYLEKLDDKKNILNILDGGSASFGNRNLKYGNIIGDFK